MGDPKIFDGKPVLQFSTETNRRSFLKYAGLVGVGASFVAGGILNAPYAAANAPAVAKGDLDILNYALTLEYLESDFYAMGLSKGFLSGRDLELVTPIGDHEKEHVTVVTSTIKSLGGTPVTSRRSPIRQALSPRGTASSRPPRCSRSWVSPPTTDRFR